ncbi:hypothetical protein N7537_008869 [Penicillium hordei]|uniref:Uncharacterized protein n=1 Tax=Penicillium hordei TaxID=40994 RepID=A0AAD6E194_9EURO|nr:uncharacterized protein N7537_008869 [Penicillium hordei]KAJ5598785.1 hypothetical protein N7537_008869 [Penicillium hordei]
MAKLTVDPRPPVRGPSAEHDREVHTCRMVRDVWGDRIDGVAATEGACGILLCDFESDFEVVGITQTEQGALGGRGRRGRMVVAVRCTV